MINKDILIEECISLIKRPDLKKEIIAVFRPIIDLLLKEIYPYIYLALILVVISFLLILGIFIILMRLRFFTNKNFIK
tara:strand:- start:10632 stop:10865 length:234 start_codon:yes stop_codon:yes gene_type:complete